MPSSTTAACFTAVLLYVAFLTCSAAAAAAAAAAVVRCQVKKDYAEFYRSSMLYLAFISSDSLGYDFKLPLAVDVSLAALLGEGIYNFAQLLMHPIVKVRHCPLKKGYIFGLLQRTGVGGYERRAIGNM
jgi:hypothetical protein